MRKTVTISIGSMLFAIDEHAYKQLDKYLAGVRTHFASMPDAEEIVADIETRIAEEFSARMTSRKKVVVEKDVKDVIRMIGTVEDFEEFDAEEGKHSLSSTQKSQGIRLYRDGYDQVLGGVCAGIGQYFDIDPIFIRIAFALSVFFGGFGIVLYIVLWIVLPEARTAAEKVEMSGGRVTIASLEESVRKHSVSAEKRNGALSVIILSPFRVMGMVLRSISAFLVSVSPFLARLIGIIMLLISAFAVTAISIAFFAILMDPSAGVPVGVPVRDMVGHAPFTVFVFSAYLLIVIPVLLLLLFGIGLVLLRNVFSLTTATVLGVAWFGSLTVLGATAFVASPDWEAVAQRYRQESRAIHTMPLEVAGFDSLRAGGTTSVSVEYGEDVAIEVRGSEAALRAMDVSVADGTLIIGRSTPSLFCLFLCPRVSLHADIRTPHLAEVEMSGASRAEIVGFTQEEMRMRTSGAARIEADIDVRALHAALSGGSRILLHGSGSTMDLSLSGGSRLEAGDFLAQSASVRMSGGSTARISVRERLEGRLSGGSRLTYGGQPAVVDMESSGGSVAEREEATEQ